MLVVVLFPKLPMLHECHTIKSNFYVFCCELVLPNRSNTLHVTFGGHVCYLQISPLFLTFSRVFETEAR